MNETVPRITEVPNVFTLNGVSDPAAQLHVGGVNDVVHRRQFLKHQRPPRRVLC